MNIGKFIFLVMNFGLILFFTGNFYLMLGVICTVLSIIITLLFRNNFVGYYIISSQIKNYKDKIGKENRVLLLSIAFLVLSMKLSAAIAIVVEISGILLIALAILIASGYIIEGRQSGMSIGLAYYLSKAVVKIYLLLSSLIDKIVELIVKFEFYILKIES